MFVRAHLLVCWHAHLARNDTRARSACQRSSSARERGRWVPNVLASPAQGPIRPGTPRLGLIAFTCIYEVVLNFFKPGDPHENVRRHRPECQHPKNFPPLKSHGTQCHVALDRRSLVGEGTRDGGHLREHRPAPTPQKNFQNPPQRLWFESSRQRPGVDASAALPLKREGQCYRSARCPGATVAPAVSATWR